MIRNQKTFMKVSFELHLANPSWRQYTAIATGDLEADTTPSAKIKIPNVAQ